MNEVINIFYQEPDPDRWIKYDRYPRRIIRRIFRGKHKPGGIMMFALQIIQGLERLKIPYRFNDFAHAKKNPRELVCIIGKPQVLFERSWKNPILFGPGIHSHPIDYPNLFEENVNIRKFIVSCDWMEKMFLHYYPKDKLAVMPVGIDTEKWNDLSSNEKTTDFLIYLKIRWENDKFNKELVEPIKSLLSKLGLKFELIEYGKYNHEILQAKLKKSASVIFLCEHETQGLAYQQILSTNTPIYAWDRGGFWMDPAYYPEKVLFNGVSSVPYWNSQCGMKFNNFSEFEKNLNAFLFALRNGVFSPRNYVKTELNLDICTKKFLEIINSIVE